MSSIPLLFLGAATGLAALAGLTLWARRELRVRAGAVALALGTLLILYAGFLDLLSRPRPLAVALSKGEVDVLAAVPAEGEAIYLWLLLPGVAEPRYFVMPWDRDAAEQLQGAQREAGKEGGVRMRLPFENSLEDREPPMFYPLPQPAPPAKTVPEGPMEVQP